MNNQKRIYRNEQQDEYIPCTLYIYNKVYSTHMPIRIYVYSQIRQGRLRDSSQ